jgi:hypothetical protein
MQEDLTDDLGTRFASDQQTPLPADLRRATIRRNLVDAHFLVLAGILMLAILPSIPAPNPGLPRQYTRERCLFGGIAALLIAGVRYAGIGPKPRSSRRNLLKKRLCPVCLQPLERRNASGETITCSCGAVWERRFM